MKSAGIDRKAIYTDKISGSKFDRPGLNRCLGNLKRGDVLVVWRLDRLGRTVKGLIEIKDRLDDLGVELRSLSESLDMTTANGRFSFHLFAAIAQQERDLIIERTNAGLKAAVARGSKPGRRHSLTVEQKEEVRALVKTMKRKEIAERFGVSLTTINRAINK